MNFEIGKIYKPKDAKVFFEHIFIHSSQPCGSGISTIFYSVLGTDVIRKSYADPNVWEEVK